MNIAIIRDGDSDYCVIKQLITAIYKYHHSIELTDDCFFDMESLKIIDPISKYVTNSNQQQDYSLYSDIAKDCKNKIISILYTAFKKFNKEKDNSVCNKDLLIVYTDAEKVLKQKHNYFEDWAYIFDSLLWLTIEEFYQKMLEQSYNYENLPLILPLILFPSSEILVASCMYDFNKDKDKFRQLNAKPDLKQKVYETDNIPQAFRNGKLEEVISTFIVPDSLTSIYQEIPEVRKIIQILSFN